MQLIRPAIESAIDRQLPVLVFMALPTIGLAAGPSYAPILFGLAGVQLLGQLGLGRGLPKVDPPVLGLAVAFLALCWASMMWSIAPHDSLRGAGQESAIFLAMLLLCAPRHDPDDLAEDLFPVLLVACLIGAAFACLDLKYGLHSESWMTGKPGQASATKYNRGLDYLVLIAWPVLAYAWRRGQWGRALLLILAVGMAQAIGLSLAGRVAGVVGVGVLLAALLLPRVVAVAMAVGTGAWAMGGPLILRALAARRAELAPYLKASGVHRLEISDYMTARVLERPLQGWGLLSAKSVPIRPAELASYVHVDPAGVYPHDQWLELWVELGAVGAALGLAFALLVLSRVWRLPASLRPFALASFASAMAIASVNYEITTDSWWAALGATAVLFMILARYEVNRAEDGPAA